jgi:hypothetical protein
VPSWRQSIPPADEQGLSNKRLAPEELFARETLEGFKV